MRKFTFLWMLAILTLTSMNAQDRLLAKAKKMQGKELYILAEPLREYEIVGDRAHQRSGKIFQKDGAGKQTISSKLEIYVKKMVKNSEKEGKPFDAILYSDGKYAYPIRFTGPATPENNGLGKVDRVNGMPVFIMCDPLADYSIVSDKRKKRNFGAFMSMGWDKTNIREAATQWAKRFYRQKKKGEINAIHYTYGKVATGIRFEQ